MSSNNNSEVVAWGECKSVIGWIDDHRCHPEITYDIARKRLFREGPLSIPELALTTPCSKGAQVGDSKQRVKARRKKEIERYKNFVLCQKVREKYEAGVDRADIKSRFDITESFLQKVISHQIYYNAAWGSCRPGEVPDHFKALKQECEYLPGVKTGLKEYEVTDVKN